jgi:protein gp37
MADRTSIEWTESTWNPIAGCSIVSPGCTNCYAMKRAGGRLASTPKFRGLTMRSNAGPVWTGEVRLWEPALDQPLRWKRPRMIFVNSMSDLFHESVPDEWIDRIFAIMALCPQHTFQLLTKRADRMRNYCRDEHAPFRVARAMDSLLGEQDLGPEEVSPIAGYPGYFVSSHGFIYSEKRGGRRKLKPDAGEKGHLRVPLYRNGNKSYDRVLVHRIVLETFIGSPPTPDTQGRHRNGDPSNNTVSNLLWGDQEANWSDSRRHGNHRRYSKITTAQAAGIKARYETGETAASIARDFDISDTQVRNIGLGKQWATATPIEWPLPNCWKGVSVEDQRRADERIPLLLDTPAAVRWVSYEPALGPVDFEHVAHENCNPRHYYASLSGYVIDGDQSDTDKISWVVIGGESGTGARPFNIEWARSIIAQCQEAGVPVFMKQLGAKPYAEGGEGRQLQLYLRDRKGGDITEFPPDLRVREYPIVKERPQ